MTETTIEYEETVTKEENILVCDECQREVDESGVEYFARGSGPDLHFCSSCLDEFSDDWEPEYVTRASEWLDQIDDTGFELREDVELAWETTIIQSIVAIVALVGTLGGYMAPILVSLAFTALLLISILTLFTLHDIRKADRNS